MSNTVDNAVRLVGDLILVPGTSQILKGEYKSGLIHAGIGIASKLFLATPIGMAVWIATAANSYALTVNEKSLVSSLGKAASDASDAANVPAEASPS